MPAPREDAPMTWEVFVISMSTIIGMFVGGTAMAKLLDILEHRRPRTHDDDAFRRPDSTPDETEAVRHQPT